MRPSLPLLLHNLRVVLGKFTVSEQEQPPGTNDKAGDNSVDNDLSTNRTKSCQNLIPNYRQFLEIQIGHSEAIHFSAEPDPGGKALANHLFQEWQKEYGIKVTGENF